MNTATKQIVERGITHAFGSSGFPNRNAKKEIENQGDLNNLHQGVYSDLKSNEYDAFDQNVEKSNGQNSSRFDTGSINEERFITKSYDDEHCNAKNLQIKSDLFEYVPQV